MAAVSPTQAARIAGQVLTAAARSQTGTATAAADARDTAFTGAARRAAVADARLAAVAPQLSLSPPAVTGAQPGVLAVSQGPGYPRVIVVQTTLKGSLYPMLYLLTEPRAGAGYKIAESATLLPSATVHRFGPLSAGAAMPRSGAALTASVGTLLSTYAKALSYPPVKVSNPPYRSGDRFAAQLLQNAALEAAQVKGQAAFTQQHRVLPGSTVTVGQADGGALVFGALERTDAFAVKATQRLVPSPKLLAFEPKLKAATSSARLVTLELLVFELPPGAGSSPTGTAGPAGTARLVAASEHLVAGSGR